MKTAEYEKYINTNPPAESEEHYAAGEAVWLKAIQEAKDEQEYLLAELIASKQHRKDEDGNIFVETVSGLKIPLGHISEGLELLNKPNS